MNQHIDNDRETRRQLVDLVELTTYQLRRNELITGSAAVEIGVVGFLTAALALDMLLPLPVAMRVIVWALFWVVLLGTLGYGVIWPTIRRARPQDVALKIEHTIGGMHNRLLTLLDLESRPADNPPSPAFVRRLIQQTRDRLGGYRIEHVADPTRMRRAVMVVAATLVVVMLMTAVSWERLPTAMARLMMPTANIPPVTWLRIQAPGDLDVLHGDPATITAEITRGQTEAMTLHLRDAAGAWTRYPMQRDAAGGFVFTVSQVTSDYRYYLSAGRTWTPTYRIAAVPRPVVEQVKLAIELPLYMKLPQRRPVPENATRIEAPIGSTIHVESTVSGNVMRGELLLLKPETVTEHRVVDAETVWFEDELPGDAVTRGRWRWSTARAYSGVRSFVFGWDREPFGFTTRLYPLTVPGDGHVHVYVWLDRKQPPNRLTVWCRTDERRYGLTWGPSPAVRVAGKDRLEYAGKLPETGRWVRLEAPLEKLTGAKRAFKFESMDFEIDTGRASLDRPGFFERDEQDVEQVKLTPAGRSSMDYHKARDVWTGQIPVTGDVHYTVRFYNALDNASLPRQPIPIRAVADAAPSVMIERPGRDLVLAEPDPLPLVARAFDDYGIARLGLQVGASEQSFHSVRWLRQYDQPLAMRELTAALDPAAEKLQPGGAVFYRFAVEDRKAQTAYSEAYRLALATPQQQDSEDVAEKPAELEKLFEALDKLMKLPLDIADQAADLLENLPEHMQGEQGAEARREMTHPDGTPMTDDEIREMFEQMDRELSDAQHQQVSELNRQLDQQQHEAEQLAQQLAEAAEQARQSPQSAPREDQALQNMAERADQMARQLDPDVKSPDQPGQLERLARAPLSEQQQQELQRMQRDLKQLQQSRQNLASNPQQSQQRNENIVARQRGQQAAGDLDTLGRELQQRQQANQQLREQFEQLQRDAGELDPADTERKNQLAEQQSELAAAAEQQMQADRQLLGEGPGESAAADEPADDAKKAEAETAQQQLGDNAQKLEQTKQQAGEARDEVGQLLSQMDESDQPAENGPSPSQSQQQQPAQQMEQLLDSPRVKRLLAMAERAKGQADDPDDPGQGESQSMQKGGKSASQGDQPGEPSDQLGGGGGSVSNTGDNTGPLSQFGKDPQQRAAIHRLPPRLRQPLLQGMQERGPEGYQPLIDAYYRQLTRESAP